MYTPSICYLSYILSAIHSDSSSEAHSTLPSALALISVSSRTCTLSNGVQFSNKCVILPQVTMFQLAVSAAFLSLSSAYRITNIFKVTALASDIAANGSHTPLTENSLLVAIVRSANQLDPACVNSAAVSGIISSQ